DGEVGVHGGVVEKVGLHRLAEVPRTKNKSAKTMRAVTAHDVPENRMIADGHHWLWAELCLFPQSCAQTAAEDEHRYIGCLITHFENLSSPSLPNCLPCGRSGVGRARKYPRQSRGPYISLLLQDSCTPRRGTAARAWGARIMSCGRKLNDSIIGNSSRRRRACSVRSGQNSEPEFAMELDGPATVGVGRVAAADKPRNA